MKRPTYETAVKAVLLAALFGGAVGRAATVPYAESFESYQVGASITNAGWTGAATSGVVTNPADVISALTTYTSTPGCAYPLPSATHTQVLCVAGPLSNSIVSATDVVVITDLLLMPSHRDSPPAGSTNYQFACYVSTNSKLVVWYHDIVANSNQWVLLGSSPSLDTGKWSRITVWQGYSQKRYQVAINGGSPISDQKGWDTPSGSGHPGPWFDMVQTNGYTSRFRTEGTATAYLDDLVVTNRSLSFSGTTFSETNANNGGISNSITIGLSGDTFANVSLLVAGVHFTTSGIPAGLSLVLTRNSTTQLTATLAGQASAHRSPDSTNMVLQFLDEAFTLGGAANVTGYSNTLAIAFNDSPVLSYTGAPFSEGGENDGGIGNSVTINLSGETFAHVSPLVAGEHYTTLGVPAGLSLELTTNSSTQLTATLTDKATAHESANSTNFTLSFLSAAFSAVAASDITGSTTNLAVEFVSGGGELTYSTDIYYESSVNDGTVLGGTISLAGAFFSGGVGEDFVATGKVQTNNVPTGLTVGLTMNATSNGLTVTFGGKAADHAGENNVTSLAFTFTDGAFVGGSASGVSGYDRNNLQISFLNQPALSYVPTTFSESVTNNGGVGNTVLVTLTGTTFQATLGASDFLAGGVPDGLTLAVTRVDETNAILALTGLAQSHTSGDSTNIAFAFKDSAFDLVSTGNIAGASATLGVAFSDQPWLVWSDTNYREATADDGTIGTTNTLVLNGGETFTGEIGDNFSNRVTVANVPSGLTCVVTRVSNATTLQVVLSGTAQDHSVRDVTLSFGLSDSAFSVVPAANVTGSASELTLHFIDLRVVTTNSVPYQESFESYDNGFDMANTGGWQANTGAAVVTNDPAIVAELAAAGAVSGFPLDLNHDKVLRLNGGDTTVETRSTPGGAWTIECMLYADPVDILPGPSTNRQIAVCVGTNQQLYVWRRNKDTSLNEWAALTNGGLTVSTGAWHRVALIADYDRGVYSIKVDGAVISDPNGMATAGGSSPGRWFYMAQTNGYLSRLRFRMERTVTTAYVDDVCIRSPHVGSVYRIR